MATYEVTGPDEKRYRVTAPDSATQAEVLERVKRQAANDTFRAPKAEPEVDSGKEAITEGAYGLARGAVGLPNLAYRGIDWLGEKATGTGFLPNLEDSPLYKEMYERDPQTTAG